MSWVLYERIHFVTSWRSDSVHLDERYRLTASKTGLPWRWGVDILELDKRSDVCVVAPYQWWDSGLWGDMSWLNERDAYSLIGFETLCGACEVQGLPIRRKVPHRSDRPGSHVFRKKRVLDL